MKTSRINFTGLDARPLKSLVIRDVGAGKHFEKLVEELSDIGRKSEFDVFVQTPKKIVNGSDYSYNPENCFPNEFYFPWAQDNLTFLPNGNLLANWFLESFNHVVENSFKRPLKKLKHHLQGGNFFIIKEGNKNSAVVGSDEFDYYRIETIKKDLDINKIYLLSQPDFHLDLGIRPLKDRVILVNDDNLMSEALLNGITKARNYLRTNHDPKIRSVQLLLEDTKEVFEIGRMKNQYKNTEKIIEELKAQDFRPVRVPGCFIRPVSPGDKEQCNHYMANFMNAVVQEKSDGSLVYITNKSLLDDITGITPEVEKKLGFSFQKAFTDSVKDYIKKENVHFVNADGYISGCLEFAQGGIHCLCAEVPKIE